MPVITYTTLTLQWLVWYGTVRFGKVWFGEADVTIYTATSRGNFNKWTVGKVNGTKGVVSCIFVQFLVLSVV